MLDFFKNKSVFNQLSLFSLSVRLSFVTALVAVLWFASAQPAIDSSTDDELRARITEIQSSTADSEASLDDDIKPLALLAGATHIAPIVLMTIALIFTAYVPRRTPFYHTLPRSPPAI